MKKVKRVLALLAAFALVLAMAVPAWAEGTTCSITAPNNGHTYEVYQIFTGTLTEDSGTKVLSDIKWGKNGINDRTPVTVGESVPETVLNAIKGVAAKSDSEKLTVIEKYVDLTGEKFNTVSSGTTENVPAGYYLIKDTDNSYNNQHDAYTQFIVEVAGKVSFQPKTDYPTVEKKVQENSKTNDTTGDYGEKYNDVADYSIGDAVPFKLIGSVPDMSQYSTSYKYTFHDTLAESLKAPAQADVKVYISSDKAGSDKQDITSNFTVTVSGQKITVHTDNLKTITGISADKYILVEYSAVLNSKAAINKENVTGTSNGNINQVYLTYSNNPRNESEAGKTPEDTVIVFTYKIEATKVDGETNENLKGVTFRIYKMSGDKKLYAQVAEGKLNGWVKPADADNNCVLTSGEDGKFSLAGLDDGTYFIEEITPLPGYNSIDPVEIQVNGNTKNGQSGNGATSELTSVTFTVGEKTENAITIVNNAGTTLPSTGGMGTTVFYVVGGGLMAVAVVLLVTKKRMENKR